MSTELINRISIKKDGVYVSTHSNNDTAPYHSVKVDFFTEAYRKGGQRELDKEVIDMFFYNADFRGNHKSILPYKNAINHAIHNKDFIEIRNKYNEMDNKAFNIANRFDEYKNLSKEEANKKYLEIKPMIEKLKNQRNEFVAELVEKERIKINGQKELKDGIYKIIPEHRIEEKTEVTEFRKKQLRNDYMMLKRLCSECDNYLHTGDVYNLYYRAVGSQIDEMKRIYNSFSEEEKPEWINSDDIKNYEEKMIEMLEKNEEEENCQ